MAKKQKLCQNWSGPTLELKKTSADRVDLNPRPLAVRAGDALGLSYGRHGALFRTILVPITARKTPLREDD